MSLSYRRRREMGEDSAGGFQCGPPAPNSDSGTLAVLARFLETISPRERGLTV
jgi:hypothetical protein